MALPPSVQPPTCTASDGTVFRCYSPQLIKQAYDFPTGSGAPTGSGQTIVIVDAFGNPSAAADLAAFDADFGLPAPPSFTIVGPNGTGDPTDPNVQAWQLETALDVEWAHALAPAAKIVLVVSETDDDLVMNAAEAAALPHYPGAIVSHSFGSTETDDVPGDVALHRIFVAAQRLGDTLIASAGDFGATNGGETASASYPASDPLVTSVGGTEGQPYPDGLIDRHGRYRNEQVWNEGDTYDLATGGAPSVLFRAPSWQQGFSRMSARTTPDVSFDAAVNGGVLVVQDHVVTLMGGTSVGSPSWAAVVALANELRARGGGQPVGFANPALYRVAQDGRRYRNDYHDITVGNNALDSPIGFSARPGYDLATGLGTPDVGNLLADLTSSSGDDRADGGDLSDPSGGGRGHGGVHRHVGR
jgi:subtilase family serine protease